MTSQLLKGQNIRPAAGVLIIAGLVASIVLAGWVEPALAGVESLRYIRFAVWAVIIVEAVLCMRLSVKSYRYTADGEHFVVELVYRDHTRVIHDIPAGQILAVGLKDDVFKAYGNAQAYDKAVLRQSPHETRAVAYKKDGDEMARLLLIQPDESMLEALEDMMNVRSATQAQSR